MRLQNLPRLTSVIIVAIAVAGTGVAAEPSADETPDPPKLAFPVDCTLGADCWIQHYVDRDPSGVPRDYKCGSLTYSKHNGTDIRIPDMRAQSSGVNVVAAADGKVLRLRDGVADVSVRLRGLSSVEGIECGNGLVVDHGHGWQTQYCHLAKGSILPKVGDSVKAGQPLGRVGLSGQTEFPHLHLTVWRNGVVVDPFAIGSPMPGACGGGPTLWKTSPAYAPRAIVNEGFSDRAVDMANIEAGTIVAPTDQSPYIVAYVRVIGLKKGDRPSLTLFGPEGETLAPSPAFTLASDQDQRFLMVGKKRPISGWKPGTYRAEYLVKSGDATELQKSFSLTIS